MRRTGSPSGPLPDGRFGEHGGMHAHPDRTVHLLFKTHLDIGFTAAAETVVNGYLEHYLPKAIVLANAKRNAGSDRFVWTVATGCTTNSKPLGNSNARREIPHWHA